MIFFEVLYGFLVIINEMDCKEIYFNLEAKAFKKSTVNINF